MGHWDASKYSRQCGYKSQSSAAKSCLKGRRRSKVSLRWHYPDQVQGSAANDAALSARLSKLPRTIAIGLASGLMSQTAPPDIGLSLAAGRNRVKFAAQIIVVFARRVVRG